MSSLFSKSANANKKNKKQNKHNEKLMCNKKVLYFFHKNAPINYKSPILIKNTYMWLIQFHQNHQAVTKMIELKLVVVELVVVKLAVVATMKLVPTMLTKYEKLL